MPERSWRKFIGIHRSSVNRLIVIDIQIVADAEAPSLHIREKVIKTIEQYNSCVHSVWSFSETLRCIWPILRIVSTKKRYPEEFWIRQRQVVRSLSSVHDRSEGYLEDNEPPAFSLRRMR
jgi:hypothetical protein